MYEREVDVHMYGCLDNGTILGMCVLFTRYFMMMFFHLLYNYGENLMHLFLFKITLIIHIVDSSYRYFITIRNYFYNSSHLHRAVNVAMRNGQKALLLTVTLIALMTGYAVSGLLTTSRTLGSSGSVKFINVEVYWDLSCTQIVNTVDWGAPEAGEQVDRTMYVKNTGNAPMTLYLYTSNWVPSGADSDIALTWDREGASINDGEVLEAVLTLSVSSSITGVTDFSFDITIEGSG